MHHFSINLIIYFPAVQILARDGEHNVNEKWISLIGDLAGCISIKRPKEVNLWYLFSLLLLFTLFVLQDSTVWLPMLAAYSLLVYIIICVCMYIYLCVNVCILVFCCLCILLWIAVCDCRYVKAP